MSSSRLAPALLAPAFLAPTLLAAAPSAEAAARPHASGVLVTLFGGLALFLFGMEQLSRALRTVAGEQMRRVLARLTDNRVLAAATGAFVTAVIQSSSVTTVLVVGFVSAGLMSLTQSVGVIMGANVGTTITAQVFAFQITELALLLIALGFALSFFGKGKKIRHHGNVVLGLGLIFLGMRVMGEAMAPLAAHAPFLEALARLESPAWGIFAGALFTAVVQSSSATTGIVIVLASQGLLSLPAGIALALGANVGTCVTALLAAIGRPREALRASLAHVLFNLVGVLLWLPAIGLLAEAVVALSPKAVELAGSARLAAETPRQIANAHTLFNLANTVLLLGFSGRLARLVERLVPDRGPAEARPVRARFLDAALLSTPALALDRVRLELEHMGEHVVGMMRRILPALVSGSEATLREIAARDDVVDTLHGEVISYLGKVTQAELAPEQTEEVLQLMEVATSLENIGDIVETNLVSLGLDRIERQVRISEATREVLFEFHRAVGRALEASLRATTLKSVEEAKVVTGMKAEINRLAAAAARHQAARLVAAEPGRLPAYAIEADILQNLKRIYYFSKRMARAAVPSIRIDA